MSDLEKIKFKISQITRSALETIKSGMTHKEVLKLIGKPRGEDNRLLYTGKGFWNYGNIWIYFENNIVRGYISNNDWHGSIYYAVRSGTVRSGLKFFPER